MTTETKQFILQALCVIGVFAFVLLDKASAEVAIAFVAGIIIPSPITTAIAAKKDQ